MASPFTISILFSINGAIWCRNGHIVLFHLCFHLWSCDAFFVRRDVFFALFLLHFECDGAAAPASPPPRSSPAYVFSHACNRHDISCRVIFLIIGSSDFCRLTIHFTPQRLTLAATESTKRMSFMFQWFLRKISHSCRHTRTIYAEGCTHTHTYSSMHFLWALHWLHSHSVGFTRNCEFIGISLWQRTR